LVLAIASSYGMVPNCGTMVSSQNEQASWAAWIRLKISSGVPMSRLDAW
jgi:hypothetical protein